MNWNETRQFLAPCFPEEVRQELDMLLPGELREIRIRVNRPTIFTTATRTAALPWMPNQQELTALVEGLSGHSLYARTNETSQGFITLQGGHRMGLCGQATNTDSRPVISEFGSVCIRIASEWPGTADRLMHYFSDQPWSVLIIGAPGSGKTTMLRDLSRQLSTIQKSVSVSIVDERGELAACLNGIPQLDIGNADVLSGFPKVEAIPWLVRSMAPQLIITDELGNANDASAILDTLSCGIAVCASAHGCSLTDAASRPTLATLMSRRAFDLYAVLAPEGGGHIVSLYDRTGNPLS